MGSMTYGTNRNQKKNSWDRRRKVAGAVAAVLAVLFLIPMVMQIFQYAHAVTQDEINGLYSQQEQLENEKGQLQTRLDQLQKKENSAIERCNVLDKKISVLNKQLGNTEKMLNQYNGQIKENKKKLKKAKKEEAEYYDLFCQRIRNMEENGSTSYWQILFGASGFSDFLDRAAFVSSVMEYDDEVLTGLEEARQKVDVATKELREKKKEKEKTLDALEQQRKEINKASDQASAALAEIQDNQEAYGDRLAEMNAMADELAVDIVSAEADYAAQQQAAAEEALRQEEAAEAERQRQEEEARHQQETAEAAQQQETDPVPAAEEADETNEADETETVPQEEEQAPAPAPVSSGASGASVVNYAMQFIGGKYVWGGSNLATGVDCSGFVMCVYQHFGYSLPHYSESLACCGTGVSYAQAQPGDIICYSGHCGIYIGGGMMVNALGAKYGIVVNNVNTGRLKAVRRIV